MTIPILYEDEDVLIINKPAGLVVHADGRTKEDTLVDWILKKYPEMKEVGEALRLRSGQADEEIIHRPGIVHRLDRDTSGAMVIAKNQDSFIRLKGQFQDREVHKIYHAFVYGVMKADDGTIDRPITRSKKDFRLWSAQRGGRGEEREAVTDYRVMERSDKLTFVEVMPKTGRTHQIRVHFKAINHPVVCDPLYAPKQKSALGFKRLALHARSIEFVAGNRDVIKVEAPYPADFKAAIAKFKAV
jgi:23S rRNA pseudouridine1911/1915/1917 synthase